MTVPFTQTLTLRTRTVTGTDSDGNDVYGSSDTSVKGVIGPGPSSELTSGQDMVTTQPTAYLPATVDPTAVDAILDGTVVYEVDGEPQIWPANPFGGWRPPLPVVVPLRRVTG